MAEKSAGASGMAPIPQAGGKAEASLKALASTPLIQRLNNYEAAMYGDAGKIPKVCLNHLFVCVCFLFFSCSFIDENQQKCFNHLFVCVFFLLIHRYKPARSSERLNYYFLATSVSPCAHASHVHAAYH